MTQSFSDSSGPLLLTGATGRLGQSVLSMIPAERELRLLVLPDDPSADELARTRANLFRADLGSGAEDLREATKGVCAVVHLAAQLPGPGVTSHQLFDSIVAGTFHLLEAVATEAPKARFIYVSSSAVYGPQLPQLTDPITEEHPIRPTSIYGAAKAAAETMVQTSQRRHGLRSTIIRPSDIVVAEDILTPDGFVGRRLGIDPEAGVLRVPVAKDDRSTTISFASADDVARGILLALSNGAAIGEAYHIGPRKSPTDLQIAEVIARQRGWVVEKVEASDEISHWVLDSTKARTALGFETNEDIRPLMKRGSGA